MDKNMKSTAQNKEDSNCQPPSWILSNRK